MIRRSVISAIFSLLILAGAFAGGSKDTSAADAADSSDVVSGAGGNASSAPSAPGDGDPPGPPPDGTAGGPGMQTTAPETLEAVYALAEGSASKTGETYAAVAGDQSAIYAAGSARLSVANATITKRGDTSSEDSSNFYGLNAAVVASDGASIGLTGSTITTSADGSNAVFATGDGTKISVSDLIINTTSDSSRGLDATYNGTVIADNVTITTAGAHCAALATDRGEGTVTVANSRGRTSGEGSPGIYSTGAISAVNSSFVATGSEAAVIEGKNSITLKDSDISGAARAGVMIYQSFSGDAGTGTGTLVMTGGSITSSAGPLFYVTNTDAVIDLTSVTLKNSTAVLLKAGPDRWGNEGSNGGSVSMKVASQKLEGSVILDKTSSASISLEAGSVLTGAINAENSGAKVTVILDVSSVWNVTNDSYVSVIADGNAAFANINSNGFTVHYDATDAANSALGGKTVSLAGGGKLAPAK